MNSDINNSDKESITDAQSSSLPQIIEAKNKANKSDATGNVQDMSQYQDLKEIINSFINKIGRFQTIIVFLLCLNSITVSINHTLTSFHTYRPTFFCRDDNTTDPCTYELNGTQCPAGYEFDEVDDRTIVVEWSLVCDRRALAPLVNTLYFVGVTFGAIICGTLADTWGRQKLVLGCLYMQAVMAMGLYFSNSLELFIVLRILQGFFVQGVQNCTYTLMLEYCPARFRTAAGVLWELNWAVGLGVLGIAGYFIRTWRVLTLVLLIPTALSVTYFWMIPESVTWLYAKGRYREAFCLTYKIAKKNNDIAVMQDCDKICMDDKYDNDPKDATVAIMREKTGALDIVRCAVLRKHLIIMISIWFSVTLSYYGILFFLPGLAGQRHVNFLIGAGLEAIAYILAYFILSNCGRRIPMSTYQYLNGVLCMTMGIVFTYADASPAKEWSLIVLALVAKGLVVSSFCGMFIYCSELFPTVCRGSAMGVCGFAARCGSLLAPQLIALVEYAPSYTPMVVMAVAVFVTGTATLMLPETLSTDLPNTIREASEMRTQN